MNYQVLGMQMKKARKAQKRTQKSVAQAAGLSTAYYGHIERGTRICSLHTFYSLCSVLQLSADEILSASAEETQDAQNNL